MVPVCSEGVLKIEAGEGEKVIRLIRIHIEEDAGKSIHDIGEFAVDIPLIISNHNDLAPLAAH